MISKDVNDLVAISFAIHILVYLLCFTASFLPLFDASPRTFRLSKYSEPFLRWDAFHFASIAEGGYLYEYQWAFFPGAPFVMKYGQQLLKYLIGYSDLMLGGALITMACSPKVAYLATLLSLMSSSPATLRLAVYAEPFFTFFSYRGMWACARSRYFEASLYFALAGTFRSNGILLGGFILWDLIVLPLFQTRRIYLRKALYAIPLTAIVFTPFIYHQYSGYLAFCTQAEGEPPEWCSKALPLIYSHVQSKYWDSGFLLYWTVAQIPNFLIAAPPLISIISFSCFVLKNQIGRYTDSPLTRLPLVPHAIHALILSCTLIFSAHVQIVLRLAASMPITYWAAAWLVIDHPKTGRWWVGWSIVWGTISAVLWATFLPPA